MKTRGLVLACSLAILIAASAQAAYQVRVYVPETQNTVAGELRVGQPGDIVIQLTTDEPLSVIKIPLELLSSTGNNLWPAIAPNQVTFLPDAQLLSTQLINLSTWQQGTDGSDTLIFWASSSGEDIVAGTHDLIKISVTPALTGTIDLSAVSFSVGMVRHELLLCGPEMEGSCMSSATFVADPIVVSSCQVNCEGCCTGRTGNIDLTGAYPAEIDLADLGIIVDFLFNSPGAVTLLCTNEANLDNNGSVDLSDLGVMVEYIFSDPGEVSLPDCL